MKCGTWGQAAASADAAQQLDRLGQPSGHGCGDADDQDVEADDPLGLGEGRAELPLQGGEGDVDGGRVEEDHEDAGDDAGQGVPGPGRQGAEE